MFKKFNYTPSKYYYGNKLNSHMESGEIIYSDFKEQTKKQLDSFINENGIIDGTALKNHWFEIGKADVFLSHSHKDINRVKAFAGWLYDEFNLTSFIDSCVWGYCDDLLRMIDDTYCKNSKSDTYNYTLRNYTTSHVHSMLSSAITEMMDNTECLLFFNTPNSLSMPEELEGLRTKNSTTFSPWIYHELSMSTMIRLRPPQRRPFLEHFDTGYSHRNGPIEIAYDVSKYVREMIELNDSTLEKWKEEYNSDDNHALDILYNIINK